MKGKRINYEDDIVKVYKGKKLIYKGWEDYEPMRDEPWKWDESTGSYKLGEYRKVCIG